MNVLEKVRSLFRAFGDLQAEVRDLRARLDAAEARIAVLEARPVVPSIPAPQAPLGPLSPYPWPDPGPFVIDPYVTTAADRVRRLSCASPAVIDNYRSFVQLSGIDQHQPWVEATKDGYRGRVGVDAYVGPLRTYQHSAEEDALAHIE